MAHDKNINTLLDLDGVVIEQVGGYWTKFEVRRIPKITEEIPHGIRLALRCMIVMVNVLWALTMLML